MSFNKSEASKQAINIVTTALQSQSIKLTGPNQSNSEYAIKNAAADAAYLSKLLADLAASLEKLS